MSADATKSSNTGIDCNRVAREEILESYVVGRLTEQEREAFEEHYFECARCFGELQAVQAVREELQRTGPGTEAQTVPPFRRWAPVIAMAAVVILAVGGLLWTRSARPPAMPERIEGQRETRTQAHEQPPDQGPEPTVPSKPSLEQLALVEPPRYEPLTLRGATDDATARFRSGMARYRTQDYRRAVADLGAAEKLDPDAAHIRFFLGVSYLMLGQNSAAIDRLRATIAIGDSPYLEEAHFYLAKAFLGREDVAAAETHLKRVIQLRGSRSDEARRLLRHLENVERGSE
jgi:tetratricopeptide (TPR) repeat protein